MSTFSSRLPWQRPINALWRLLDDKRAAAAGPLLDLTTSNPTTVGLDYPAAIHHALDDARALVYQPSPRGDAEARRAVARYYAGRGLSVDPEHLILTASTSEAYGWLFKLLCGPGQSVLMPRPSYPLFDLLASLEAVELVPYQLGHDDTFFLDLEPLRSAPPAQALLLVHPNNPTGTFLKRSELDGLATLAAARGLPLICDEVFGDYAFAPDPGRVPSLVTEQRTLTFTLSGLSKVLGLPQLKLGWIHVSGPPALVEEALAGLELIADTYLSVSTPIALAAPRLLALQPQLQSMIAARTVDNLRRARRAVVGSPVTVLPVEGGWYATLQLPRTRSDEEWALDLLATDDVVVQPGYFFDHTRESLLVVSLLTPPEVFEEGLSRIVQRSNSR